MKGYNEEQLVDTYINIAQQNEDIYAILKRQNESDFVAPMSEVWGCIYAQDFFKDYQSDIDKLVKSIDETYGSILGAISSAASKFAAMGGDEEWSIRQSLGQEILSERRESINISIIKDNVNGIKGINDVSAERILSRLDSLEGELSAILSRTEATVNESGFFGGNMQSNLKDSVSKIRKSIEDSFTQIRTKAKNDIQQTIAEYGKLIDVTEGNFTVSE